MGMYHRQQPKKPTDKSDERKLLTTRQIEKGAHTSKGEKGSLMGTLKKTPTKSKPKAKK